MLQASTEIDDLRLGYLHIFIGYASDLAVEHADQPHSEGLGDKLDDSAL